MRKIPSDREVNLLIMQNETNFTWCFKYPALQSTPPPACNESSKEKVEKASVLSLFCLVWFGFCFGAWGAHIVEYKFVKSHTRNF